MASSVRDTSSSGSSSSADPSENSRPMSTNFAAKDLRFHLMRSLRVCSSTLFAALTSCKNLGFFAVRMSLQIPSCTLSKKWSFQSSSICVHMPRHLGKVFLILPMALSRCMTYLPTHSSSHCDIKYNSCCRISKDICDSWTHAIIPRILLRGCPSSSMCHNTLQVLG